MIRILEDNGYFRGGDEEALRSSAEDLRRASLSKNRKILDPLSESFKGTALEERAILHYRGEKGERLARLLSATDLKAVWKLAPKGESPEWIEAALDRNLSAPWRTRKILETEHHGAFQAAGVEKAAASGRQRKTWHTQGDDRVRPSHRALSGVTIAIDAVFWNGLSYPSDPFCRCYLTFSGEGAGRDLVLW